MIRSPRSCAPIAFLAALCLATLALAKPLVIAHRGASGYLPEHTLEAYTLAFAQGADVIEPDVVLTRDGALICAHDLVMDEVTDVAQKYPGRAREDGKSYWIDFDLAEIKTLHKTGRATRDALGFNVATLDEMLDLIARLNTAFARTVGVIPEPKDPAFHRSEGQPIEHPLLDALARLGYSDTDSGAIVQCFDLDSLRTMRHEMKTTLPLVWLMGEMPTAAQLDDAASFVEGLGPSRKLIEDKGEPVRAGWLVEQARARDLALYPYTFNMDTDAMARFFHTYRVEGLFTNNPDLGRAAADQSP